ncbi:hypothetical protein ACEPAF_8384 [Sanghuangporus sanghuang]
MEANGGFCDVFVGNVLSKHLLHSRTTSEEPIVKVAIKRLRVRLGRDMQLAKSLAREMRIWSKLDHPNILPLLGYMLESDYPSLISEWMEFGTVRNFLNNHPEWSIAHLALGVAAGLEFMHARDIIHSDLKADNILISKYYQPLICDFGISRILDSSQSAFVSTTHDGHAKGSMRWMAVELLDPCEDVEPKHSKETDVWAFGMTLYEMVLKNLPYYHLKQDARVVLAVMNGELPMLPSFSEIDTHLSASTYSLFCAICRGCWARSPEERPTMSQIMGRLLLLLSSNTQASVEDTLVLKRNDAATVSLNSILPFHVKLKERVITLEMSKQAIIQIKQMKREAIREGRKDLSCVLLLSSLTFERLCKVLQPEPPKFLSDEDRVVFHHRFEVLYNLIKDCLKSLPFYLSATDDEETVKSIIKMEDICAKQQLLLPQVYVLDVPALQALVEKSLTYRLRVFWICSELHIMSSTEQNKRQQAGAPTDPRQNSTHPRVSSQRQMNEGLPQDLSSSSSARFGGSTVTRVPTSPEFNVGGGLYDLHSRRSSTDAYSNGDYLSTPKSAASSSPHLPLEYGSNTQTKGCEQVHPLSTSDRFDEYQQALSRESTLSPSLLSSEASVDMPFVANFNCVENSRSAEETTSFFTQHAMKLAPQGLTPRLLQNEENGMVATPRNLEHEIRELKEFWKQYLSTPLTGPSLGAVSKSELPNNQLASLGDGSRLTPELGLPGAVSLQSVRATADENAVVPFHVTNSKSQARAQHPALQNKEDLKRFEQAVLARSPPNLTLVQPPKGRHSISSSASPHSASDRQSQPPGAGLELGSIEDRKSIDDGPGPGEPSPECGVKRPAPQVLEDLIQKRAKVRRDECEDAVDGSESDAEESSDTGSPSNRFDGLHSSMWASNMSLTNYHRSIQFAHSGTGGPGSGTETLHSAMDVVSISASDSINATPAAIENPVTTAINGPIGDANVVGTALASSLLDRFRQQSEPSGLRTNIAGVEMIDGKMDESCPSLVSYTVSPLQASHVVENAQLNPPPLGLPGVDGNALMQT